MANQYKKWSLVKNNEIVCNKSILLSIISLATKEITGVADMDNRLYSRIKDKFCSNYFEGAKVKVLKDGKLIIDVYIKMYINYNVSEIACKVQENIRSSVNSMLGREIKSINVHVIDVILEDSIKETI